MLHDIFRLLIKPFVLERFCWFITKCVCIDFVILYDVSTELIIRKKNPDKFPPGHNPPGQNPPRILSGGLCTGGFCPVTP